MTVPEKALGKREEARECALGSPGAREEFPRAEPVAEADGRVFVLPGVRGGSHPVGVTPGPTQETVRARAPASPGAGPADHGPGRSGPAGIRSEQRGARAAEPPCDGVEESRRAIAPERPAAEPDARRGTRGGGPGPLGAP